MDQMIPFNRASFDGNELQYVREAIATGHVSGNGPFTRRAEGMLSAGHLGAPALLTTSCTHALEMASLLSGVETGDEVIVPSFTFVTTASAFLLHGGTPRFVDVDPETLNLTPDAVARATTLKTRAVCAVNYAGIGAQLDELADLCSQHNLTLIEDNAHGLFGTYAGSPLGTYGSLSALSFHETKNLSCGEGGALVINDPTLVERAEILREKGTDRSKFFRGEVDKYTWVDHGSSWIPSDMLAAILVGQLERFDEVQGIRRRIWEAYMEGLAPWADREGIRLPVIPSNSEQTHHIFHLRLHDGRERDRFIAHMKRSGVSTTFHYQPLHLSKVGRTLGGKPGDCPVSEDAAETLVRLPLHTSLDPEDVKQVINAATSFPST